MQQPALPLQLPPPPEQPPAPQGDPVKDPEQPAQIPVQPGQPQLNWSYFKPEFSGKPEEDAEDPQFPRGSKGTKIPFNSYRRS